MLAYCALRKPMAVILDKEFVFVRVSEGRSDLLDKDGHFLLHLGVHT